ncbi:UvrD-helicase domain-containing protein [Cognatiluteimonas weifangensis]|uniref:RecBCD enzyme subunit RecB n=1 Tax=Cognatiluteimonas weifangensis TaxID=2303539 RepID=A0A372DPF8_9GAMM|nr:exodeoxyribonuclease V subunit beta [Luteimonas weifangensis]RFP61460.1 exodeoxyribonuclease V subunit beta [Luteimonas weifangensis]
MNAAPVRDPYLELPLDGVRLIEASAGTGKTFTLATLVVRLVVERGLRVGQVLAVTFTEAATQELRKRIRERLLLALELVDAPASDDDSAEVALTRAILHAHRARSGESEAALRRRLRQAALEVDLAAIFTIHGFCARVLREHALESGQGFDPPTLLANDRDLRAELAADLWRAHGRDAAGADDLAALWKTGPAALADDLRALLHEPRLLPPDAPLPADPAPALSAAADKLIAAIDVHAADAQALIAQAFDRKILHGGRVRRPSFDKAFAELQAGCEARHWPRGDKLHLDKLHPVRLQTFCHDDKRDQVPSSPLFEAFAAWCAADDAVQAYQARRRVALLHRIRDDARVRLAALKRQRRVQTYDDLIDGVADALDGPRGDALARGLRKQYAAALVDEFQDTDARQWKIFDRVFGAAAPQHGSDPDGPAEGPSPPALESARTDGSRTRFLALIGDPKQAIYGFRGGDVHAYLAAGRLAAHAPALSHNFRSRPSLLAAIEALYAQAGEAAFVDPRIEFHPVVAGGKRSDADFLRDGAPAPALTLWQAPAPNQRDAKGHAKPWSADESRALATTACVAAIHGVLRAARDGRARLDGAPVQPGDIAVLVRTHHEASRIQQALAEVGIPAVAAGKLSLFATGEARELHTLLLALLQGGDDGRLRAALATVLVGEDAAAIDALDRPGDLSGGEAHREWQRKALAWRERLLRGGPLALVGELCAAHAPRLLGLVDGERRVSNYLQLAEALQVAQAQALGLHGLVDWLGRRIAQADPDDETQLLRLESDARRVQIVTLHKSKGLEYPLVFLPFAGIGRNEPTPGRHCVAHHEANVRRLHWNIPLPEAEWENAKAAWKIEQHAEDARLLYVGMTRARHALWIASGPFFNHDKAALAPLLRDRDALAAVPGIVLDAVAPPADLPRLPPESDAAVPPARVAARALAHDWWVYSFTQLSSAEAGDDPSAAATLPAPGGRDELAAPDDGAADDVRDISAAAATDAAFDPRFAGPRFGVALHAALEHADFAAWRGWQPGEDAPAGEARTIAAALRAEGYAADVLDAGSALVTQLVGHTLRVALPEGVRLCELPPDARRPEIEFQFALQPTRVDALLQLLHAHGVLRERRGFGLRQRLEGLMTGLIDLTYVHAGKWYVLDYKSNRLPRYDAAALDEAMAHSEYDLQALIYTLALHRWLRFRLGDAGAGGGYDYARDFGGIRYLFCRGLDLHAAAPAPGVHAQRFAPELIHALDALFAGEPGPRPRDRDAGMRKRAEAPA